jgi:hypothetical protein
MTVGDAIRLSVCDACRITLYGAVNVGALEKEFVALCLNEILEIVDKVSLECYEEMRHVNMTLDTISALRSHKQKAIHLIRERTNKLIPFVEVS